MLQQTPDMQLFTTEWHPLPDTLDFESAIAPLPKEVQAQQPILERNVSPARRAQTNFNRLSVGLPIVQPLTELLPRKQIAPNIRALLRDYEVYQVQMACSFQPISGYQFVTANFEVKLATYPQNPSGPPLSAHAIAYDLFPLRVEDEYNLSSKLSISPQLKFTSAPVVEVQVDGFGVERTKTRTTYQGRIIAFGLQEATCGWSFSRTEAHELSGSYRVHLLVCKPPHSLVRGSFSLNAKIQQKGGGIPALFKLYRSPSGPIVEVPECPLC